MNRKQLIAALARAGTGKDEDDVIVGVLNAKGTFMSDAEIVEVKTDRFAGRLIVINVRLENE